MEKCPLCQTDVDAICMQSKDMTIFQCPGCQFMFQSEVSSAFANKALIEELYEHYLEDYDQHVLLNQSRMTRIRQVLPQPLAGLRVLEIGVGPGLMAKAFIGQGADYTGVEPSPSCFQSIKKNFSEIESAVINRPVEACAFEKGQFDLIVLVDTFEHIAQPRELLLSLREWLKADGQIYLELPNESSLRFKGALRKLFGVYSGYATNPEHISLFTKKTVRKLTALTRMRITAMSQATIWGDLRRMIIIFGHKNKWWLAIVCFLFRVTKIDLLLEQGVIVAVLKKDDA